MKSLRGFPLDEHILLRSIPVPESGCWLWEGYLTEGYGRLDLGGQKWLAHRLSYRIFCGEIPAGMLVLHKCDVPCCVNPAHLYVGTDADNTRDKVLRGRHARGETHDHWDRGEDLPWAKLTAE